MPCFVDNPKGSPFTIGSSTYMRLNSLTSLESLQKNKGFSVERESKNCIAAIE